MSRLDELEQLHLEAERMKSGVWGQALWGRYTISALEAIPDLLRLARAAKAMRDDHCAEHSDGDYPCRALYPRGGVSHCTCGAQPAIDRLREFDEVLDALDGDS